MNSFKNKKGKLLTSIIISLVLLMLSIYFNFGLENKLSGIIILMYVLIFLLIVYLVWILLGTNYSIERSNLKYKSGFCQGHIKISAIKKIVIGKTLWSGLKPSTALNGLIIHFNSYDTIYITPKSNHQFVKALLRINGKIQIIDHDKVLKKT